MWAHFSYRWRAFFISYQLELHLASDEDSMGDETNDVMVKEQPLVKHDWEYKEHSPSGQTYFVGVALPYSFFPLEP